MFKQYLPELGASEQAKQVAAVSLNEARSRGRLHIAPALSPDGTQIAYFSERDGFSIDMFLADAATGQVKRRLLQPTWSSNYETFRFLNSQAAWSRDGKYLAVTGRRGKYDDIILLEPQRNKTVKRITVKLDGVTTPSWSPDGKQLVFTGYVGGYSDLFVVNADGSGLRRLTNDQYADLHPAWSPDGKSIAFTTDRGPGTNFEVLSAGNFRIGIFDLASGETHVLDHMDAGKNINPAWGPEGKYLAFVSDRGGVSDLYLYDFAQDEIYQITHLLTGSAGFTPLSPVLSWAPDADKIAFMYYEKGGFNVYLLSNPRALARTPWRAPAPEDTARRAVEVVTRVAPDSVAPRPEVGEGGSIYRGKQGFRRADSVPKPADSLNLPAPEPLSIARLLDSATLALPDTSEFAFQKYRKHYTPGLHRAAADRLRARQHRQRHLRQHRDHPQRRAGQQSARLRHRDQRPDQRGFRHGLVRQPGEPGQLVGRGHPDPVLLRRAQYHRRAAGWRLRDPDQYPATLEPVRPGTAWYPSAASAASRPTSGSA